jgi:hypothetical protein
MKENIERQYAELKSALDKLGKKIEEHVTSPSSPSHAQEKEEQSPPLNQPKITEAPLPRPRPDMFRYYWALVIPGRTADAFLEPKLERRRCVPALDWPGECNESAIHRARHPVIVTQ